MKLLLMFLNETETWEGVPLHHVIVERLPRCAASPTTR